MPTAPQTPRVTVARARQQIEANHIWHLLCLRFVRTMWGLPGGTLTAQDAWWNAKHKHAWSGDVDDIPFGAPVFSMKRGGTRSDAGHVFLAGGYGPGGERLFFTNDVAESGMISRVHLDAITEGWGHTIWGWTSDLNGYDLPLPLSRNERKRRKKAAADAKAKKNKKK